MQKNSNTLKISKDGIVPKSITFEKLQESKTYELEVTTDKKNIEDISITIIVEPKGANIFIDGVGKGKSEQAITSIGNHELKLVKEGYQTVIKDIEVFATNTLFKYKLIKIDETATTYINYNLKKQNSLQ